MAPNSSAASPQFIRGDFLTQAFYEYMAKRSLPLISSEGGARYVCGTGTYFGVGSTRLLITAAHVLRSLMRDGRQVQPLLIGRGTFDYIPITGTSVSTDENDSDVGVIVLDAASAARLDVASDVAMVTLEDVYLPRDKSTEAFIACGYPCLGVDVNDRDDLRRPFAIGTLPYVGRIGETRNPVVPEYHVLLQHYVDGQRLDGGPARLPERLDGISGCSVWHRSDRQHGGVWTIEQSLRVFGIETDVNPGKWIRVTRWSAVGGLLYRALPGTRAEIERVFGRPGWADTL